MEGTAGAEALPRRLDLVIVDDHDLVRAGVRGALRSLPNANVVAEVDSGNGIDRLMQREHVDLVILDIGLREGVSGLEILRTVKRRWPTVKVLINTVHDDAKHVELCLDAGADGFYYKGDKLVGIAQAVTTVLTGAIFLSPDLVGPVIARYRAMAQSPDMQATGAEPLNRLTARQLEFLGLAAKDYSNSRIGGMLGVSAKTAANNLSIIRKKLDLQSRDQLYEFCREHRIG